MPEKPLIPAEMLSRTSPETVSPAKYVSLSNLMKNDAMVKTINYYYYIPIQDHLPSLWWQIIVKKLRISIVGLIETHSYDLSILKGIYKAWR